MMIYTIGHAETYRNTMSQITEPMLKVGKGIWQGQPYEGGYAFRTYEDAMRRIDEAYPDWGFDVFGMEADWDTETEPSEEGWWHHLLVDAPVIDLLQERRDADN